MLDARIIQGTAKAAHELLQSVEVRAAECAKLKTVFEALQFIHTLASNELATQETNGKESEEAKQEDDKEAVTTEETLAQ